MQFELTFEFDTTPEFIFNAWLNSESHTAMTGGNAEVSALEGEEFSAWDGYITGRNVQLIKNKNIIQTWRTIEFDEEQEDSIIEIELQDLLSGKTLLILKHKNLSEKDIQYKQGWIDNYFLPMQNYLNQLDII